MRPFTSAASIRRSTPPVNASSAPATSRRSTPTSSAKWLRVVCVHRVTPERSLNRDRFERAVTQIPGTRRVARVEENTAADVERVGIK
jgi:hypothetical protein